MVVVVFSSWGTGRTAATQHTKSCKHAIAHKYSHAHKQNFAFLQLHEYVRGRLHLMRGLDKGPAHRRAQLLSFLSILLKLRAGKTRMRVRRAPCPVLLNSFSCCAFTAVDCLSLFDCQPRVCFTVVSQLWWLQRRLARPLACESPAGDDRP